jgi:phosphatidylinositol glycan class B
MRWRLLESYEPKEKVALWVSLFLHICCAWFSIGYHYDDEHWQILEFANYKLGLSPASDLPWEFVDQIRPTLQPFLVYVLAKFMMALDLYNPFTLILILRLISGVLSWLATLLIIKSTRAFFIERDHFYYLILFSSFLWFIPYIHVRYSGETWSGLFFFFGLYYLLNIFESNYSKEWILKSFFAGAFMGLSFWFRFQITFAFIGLGLWILVFKLKSLRKLIPAIIGGVMILGIGILLDRWFYNNWIFTPFNYFESNILNNVAARYGETPWWDYFYLFLLHGGMPVSIFLFAMLVISIVAKPKSPYVWIMMAFLLGHMMVGHKELRFLFPMIYIFPICCFLFFDSTPILKWLSLVPKKVMSILVTTLIVINTVLLIVMVFLKPPSEHVFVYRYIYEYTKGAPAKVITLHKDPYRPAWLKANYYKPRNLEVVPIDSIKKINSYLNKEDTILFFDDHFDLLPSTIENSDVRFELLYRNVPEFIKYLNFNGWVDRTKVYCVYRPVKLGN